MSSREVIQPHPGDKRYARRNAEGQFTENQVDVGSRWRRTGAARPRRSFPRDRVTGEIKKPLLPRGSERASLQLRLKSFNNLFKGRQLRTEVFSRPALRA